MTVEKRYTVLYFDKVCSSGCEIYAQSHGPSGSGEPYLVGNLLLMCGHRWKAWARATAGMNGFYPVVGPKDDRGKLTQAMLNQLVILLSKENDTLPIYAVSIDTEGAIVVSYKLFAPDTVQPDLFDTERSDTERKVN